MLGWDYKSQVKWYFIPHFRSSAFFQILVGIYPLAFYSRDWNIL